MFLLSYSLSPFIYFLHFYVISLFSLISCPPFSYSPLLLNSLFLTSCPYSCIYFLPLYIFDFSNLPILPYSRLPFSYPPLSFKLPDPHTLPCSLFICLLLFLSPYSPFFSFSLPFILPYHLNSLILILYYILPSYAFSHSHLPILPFSRSPFLVSSLIF